MRIMKTESGLSEIVGALLLVALVIIGIGIVSVVMFSTPPPQSKEKAVLSSSSMQCDENTFVILVRHEGGDTLNPQNLKFYLTTKYYTNSFMNRFPVRATYFVPAETYSSWGKSEICAADVDQVIKSNEYKYTASSKSMVNGDVIVIWYQMDETSEN